MGLDLDNFTEHIFCFYIIY